jgi:dihydroneopterin aldolase
MVTNSGQSAGVGVVSGVEFSADRIELRGLRVLGTHGVDEVERSRPQPFEVDLDLFVDLTHAANDDELSSTVDYALIAESAVAVVAMRSFRLLEALATAIADGVLQDRRVLSVSVVVRKLRPPVAVHMASAGVRITRHRH